jgi:hypothetical protein
MQPSKCLQPQGLASSPGDRSAELSPVVPSRSSDAAAHLAVVTGLPSWEIRLLINKIKYDYSEREKLGHDENGLTSGDRKYLGKTFRRSKGPAVKAWLQSIRNASMN